MFITLEGPEGSGKTTAVEAAVKKLKEMGYEIVRTREPGGTPIAEQIRNVILDKANTSMDPSVFRRINLFIPSIFILMYFPDVSTSAFSDSLLRKSE